MNLLLTKNTHDCNETQKKPEHKAPTYASKAWQQMTEGIRRRSPRAVLMANDDSSSVRLKVYNGGSRRRMCFLRGWRWQSSRCRQPRNAAVFHPRRRSSSLPSLVTRLLLFPSTVADLSSAVLWASPRRHAWPLPHGVLVAAPSWLLEGKRLYGRFRVRIG